MLTRPSAPHDWLARPSVSMRICQPLLTQRPRFQILMLTLAFAEINETEAIRVSMAPNAC